MNNSNQKIINTRNFEFNDCLPGIGIDNLREEIIEGLNADHKYISSKYFYDEIGSKLFEEITELEEYYPTRTEKSILKSAAHELVKDIEGMTIIDLGSGDCSKISILFDAIDDHLIETLTYVPVDFSISALKESAECLYKRYPDIEINAYAADFMHDLDFIPEEDQKIFCFFGSTIGNFSNHDAIEFLRSVEKVMNNGDGLLIGLDMVKDKTTLEKAYNDEKQITAFFNKNIINSINPIIKTEIDPKNFEHLAFYNDKKKRIEMHLEAIKDQEYITPFSPMPIVFKKGENIHTENSHKFTDNDIRNFAASSGLRIKNIHRDYPDNWFSLVLFTK